MATPDHSDWPGRLLRSGRVQLLPAPERWRRHRKPAGLHRFGRRRLQTRRDREVGSGYRPDYRAGRGDRLQRHRRQRRRRHQRGPGGPGICRRQIQGGCRHLAGRAQPCAGHRKPAPARHADRIGRVHRRIARQGRADRARGRGEAQKQVEREPPRRRQGRQRRAGADPAGPTSDSPWAYLTPEEREKQPQLAEVAITTRARPKAKRSRPRARSRPRDRRTSRRTSQRISPRRRRRRMCSRRSATTTIKPLTFRRSWF